MLCRRLRILYTDPFQMYLGLARAHFLSPTGQCKSFDAAADGYCRAEGCGLFVLKRLSDALAENDRIHGVIKGVETNQSGCAHSITHPHPETQADLFRQLLTRTKTDPNTVSVVEAHGTGTQVCFSTLLPSPYMMPILNALDDRLATSRNYLVFILCLRNLGDIIIL